VVDEEEQEGSPFLFSSIAPRLCQAINQLARCSSRQGDEVCLKNSEFFGGVLRVSSPPDGKKMEAVTPLPVSLASCSRGQPVGKGNGWLTIGNS
jgi:hypothetical protein